VIPEILVREPYADGAAEPAELFITLLHLQEHHTAKIGMNLICNRIDAAFALVLNLNEVMPAGTVSPKELQEREEGEPESDEAVVVGSRNLTGVSKIVLRCQWCDAVSVWGCRSGAHKEEGNDGKDYEDCECEGQTG
jgi:hypothetical protein